MGVQIVVFVGFGFGGLNFIPKPKPKGLNFQVGLDFGLYTRFRILMAYREKERKEYEV